MTTIDEIVGLGRKVVMYSLLSVSALYSLGGDCGGGDGPTPCDSQKDCASNESCEQRCNCSMGCRDVCVSGPTPKPIPPWERADPAYGKDCADEYNMEATP